MHGSTISGIQRLYTKKLSWFGYRAHAPSRVGRRLSLPLHMLLLKQNTIPFTHLQEDRKNASAPWAQPRITSFTPLALWAGGAALLPSSPLRPRPLRSLPDSESGRWQAPTDLKPRSCSLLTQLLGHAGQVANLGRLLPQECRRAGSDSAALLSNWANRAADKEPLFWPQTRGGSAGRPGWALCPSSVPIPLCVYQEVGRGTGAKVRIPALTHDPSSENRAVHGTVPPPVLLGGPTTAGSPRNGKRGPSLLVLLGHLLPENSTGCT